MACAFVGYAVADVNYGGSTGYGRKYRKRLAGQWGVVDVDDCCAAATYLADKGLADPKQLCITGGSAGGYTTLACLAFRFVLEYIDERGFTIAKCLRPCSKARAHWVQTVLPLGRAAALILG